MTGVLLAFLPPDEFETVVDQFLAHLEHSVRGETAKMAQIRIVTEVQGCLKGHKASDVLFVGHGGIGTLLFAIYPAVRSTVSSIKTLVAAGVTLSSQAHWVGRILDGCRLKT